MMQQFNDSTVIPARPVARSRLSVVATPQAAESVEAEAPDAVKASVAPADAATTAVEAPEPSDATDASDATDNMASLGDVYTAPFGFVLNALVNRTPRSIPLVLDEDTELDAVGRSLELVSADGGFEACVLRTWRVEARIRLSGTHEAASATSNIRALQAELLEQAADALPADVKLHHPLALELLPAADDAILVRLHVEAPEGDALASALHGAARAIAPALSRLAGVRPSVRVTSKAVERFRVRCRIDAERLVSSALGEKRSGDAARSAEHAVYRAIAALGLGARDPAVAAAHNAMIESGVVAVALALGNAPARIIADAERHATRSGNRQPLSTWRSVGDAVEGELELPLDITTHGRWRAPDGAGRARGRRPSAGIDIAMLAACIGMAFSVVALIDAVRVRIDDERQPLPPSRHDAEPAAVADAPQASVHAPASDI